MRRNPFKGQQTKVNLISMSKKTQLKALQLHIIQEQYLLDQRSAQIKKEYE